MNKPSSLILLLGLGTAMYAQSPHGELLKLNCGDCHSSASWEIPASAWYESDENKTQTTPGQKLKIRFDHNATLFPLTGRHARTDCRDCHETLVFSEADPACVSCHTDMHQQTVGMDCARCHTTDNWLVDHISELHIDNGFPLLGAHATANCFDCHRSESQLRFDRIGNDCINCHREAYLASASPNHLQVGFSTNCADCHDPALAGWGAARVNHSFFPLEKGHELSDCAACHTGGNFSNTPTDCYACHRADYESTLNPNHQTSNISISCTDCHTTDPGWMPASFSQHDADYFPIYSGGHQGEWMVCADCHLNPSNFSEYTCIACHKNPETDGEHGGVNGYSYSDPACLACHPTGNADDVFDHNNTSFPLTGMHLSTQCIDCHTNGYAGTPTACSGCHSPDYDQSQNPNHATLGISTDCAVCHTTNGWAPAGFPVHGNYYALNGAHAAIANDCAACHNGNYNNTPNTCYGCHESDYKTANNPSHLAAGFPTDCTQCHSETAWIPSTFDHDAMYFPIYSGKHKGEWDACADCHTSPGNYSAFSCIDCHEHNNPTKMAQEHQGVSGYQFASPACFSCHPKGN